MELETDRLLLRPMRAEDAESLLAIFGDPSVMASFGESPFDRGQMDRWVQRNLEHQDRHGYGLFSVIQKADGLLVGDCGLEHMDVGVELGYDVRSDHWNRGLATEAAGAVRDFAFGELQLDRLVSLVRVGNGASRRVAEKLGMRVADHVDRDGIRYWLLALRARDLADVPAPHEA
jgi:RimJ/RimL family protein N-acetyltransferase